MCFLPILGNIVGTIGESVPVVSSIGGVSGLALRMLAVASANLTVSVVVCVIVKLSCLYGKLVAALSLAPVVSQIEIVLTFNSGVLTELKHTDLAPAVVIRVNVLFLCRSGNYASASGSKPVVFSVDRLGCVLCYVSVITYLITAGVAKSVLSAGYVCVSYDLGVSICVSADRGMPVTVFVACPCVRIVGVISTAYVISAGVAETVVIGVGMLSLSICRNYVSTGEIIPVVGFV